MDFKEGIELGQICNRNGCKGIIEKKDLEGGCNCISNPPCTYCTTIKEYCPVCDWDGEEEKNYYETIYLKKLEESGQISKWNEHLEKMRLKSENIKKLFHSKDLATEFDYINESHTHFSMKKYGYFPLNGEYTRNKIEEEVRGSFGGRFERFDDEIGRFVYIAYTD